MTIISGVKQVARVVTGRPAPRLLTVKEAWRLTPNMIRVTFAGSELAGIRDDCEGDNCKLLLPNSDESHIDFAKRLIDGPPPARWIVVSKNRMNLPYNKFCDRATLYKRLQMCSGFMPPEECIPAD